MIVDALIGAIIAIIAVIVLVIIIKIMTRKKVVATNAGQQQGHTTPPLTQAGNTTTPNVNPTPGHADPAHGSKGDDGHLIFVTIVVIAIIIFAVIGIVHVISPEDKKDNRNNPAKVVLPENYSETYHLKYGETLQVNIPDGYYYSYDGGGKKYYIQVNGFPKVLVGGGLPKPNQKGEELKFCYISFYEEEVTVIFTFQKKHPEV